MKSLFIIVIIVILISIGSLFVNNGINIIDNYNNRINSIMEIIDNK